ncbi:MAG: hypothetical protein JW901_09845 [Dehalococcoidia bacterium]|nr:hypothetical protein [Dehalococcoidia bacterium]
MRILLAIVLALTLLGITGVQASNIPLTYDPDTNILTVTSQEFKVLEYTPTSIKVQYLAGGLYARPGEPPGPTNPYYPCITTFRSSGFQWEKDAVDLVNNRE